MNRAQEDRTAGRIAGGIVLAIAVVGAGWWWSQRGGEAPAESAVTDPGEVAQVSTSAGDGTPPPIQHPIAPVAEPAPDAAPRDPDLVAQEAMGEVFGGGIAAWLVNEQLARRLVATVDNLPRNTRLEQLRPLRAPTAPFAVERETLDAAVGEERIVLASDNFARYDVPVALLAGVDPAAAANVYRRIYPQLQGAYEELGYPGRYFNDRLVAVLDHLLATPEPQQPLLLEQPKVLYLFADPTLEALSPGQKLLLRIGPDHARTVKQKLRELRAAVAAAPASN